MSEFIREIVFYPAYDKREESKGKYGQGSVSLAFYLKGEKGIVQFKLLTGWGAGLVPKPAEYSWREGRPVKPEGRGLMHNGLSEPMAADLGYHSLTPHYEDHSPFECELLEGGKCYYDGSTLNADPIFCTLVHEGSDGVWKALEEYYH